MNKNDIYRQMAERTQGNIYLGIVGPVRTGKSTFIKKFMELMVLPSMEKGWLKERFTDEMPQSASGKTIMTTQVQFVPDEAVEIKLPPETVASIRLIDCVGYMVDGALGHLEEDVPRMVKTPWFDYEVTFEEAAETGTQKVITDYSTIGIVVLTDGTITSIPEPNYYEAEKRVINELKELGKPFIVVVNSTMPNSISCKKKVAAIKEQYDVAAVSVDVLNMTENDIAEILGAALYEFPAKVMKFSIPDWLKTLPIKHWIWCAVIDLLQNVSEYFCRIRDYEKVVATFMLDDNIDSIFIDRVNPGDGEVLSSIMLKRSLYFKILSENCNMDIENDAHLMKIMSELASLKGEFDYFKDALEEARQTGYGLAVPRVEEMSLDTPEIIKRGRGYGVALSATAPSWHIMKADVSAQISPMVGTEQQSEDLVHYLLDGFESDPTSIWDTEIFGKSLSFLMREGLTQKLNNLPQESRLKFKDTLERVVNETGGGVVCILF